MKNNQRTTLRHQVLSRRDALSSPERTEKSRAISSGVLSLQEVESADVVLAYMHFRSEVMTSALIEQLLSEGKTVALPYTSTADRRLGTVRISDPVHQVAPGYCGIMEPLPELRKSCSLDPATIDAVIIPGSVFDPRGGRLGYGGGYYDRFLADMAPWAIRIGLAFELQLVDHVPVEDHDQFMDYVVSEKKIYPCRRNRYA